jgi:hypothetical protein
MVLGKMQKGSIFIRLCQTKNVPGTDTQRSMERLDIFTHKPSKIRPPTPVEGGAKLPCL